MSTPTPGTVLFLGTSGKIARHAGPAFQTAGWQVRYYDRAKGDMAAQARGADVIVNGLNPPNYHNWAELVPQITEQVIDAARHSGATVILPGNVYIYGNQPGLWTEDTPHRPHTRKGKIRQQMETRYAEADIQTILVRAGDFISTAPGDSDVMSLMLLNKLHRGKITTPGDPEATHAFGYLPDWAQAACMLAERRQTLDRFTDVNLGGANVSIRQLCDVHSAAQGRPLKLARFPWPVFRLTAPVWELARELLEMRYLWNLPHSLAQDKLLTLLPDYRPTDLQTILRADRYD